MKYLLFLFALLLPLGAAASWSENGDGHWGQADVDSLTLYMSAPRTRVVASASLAGDPDVLEGVDIAAAITACGTDGDCEVDLVAGTYADVCLQISRSHTHLIGAGAYGGTALHGKDLDVCEADSLPNFHGAVIRLLAADDLEFAGFEMDGQKSIRPPPTCTANWCGGAIDDATPWADPEEHVYIHDLYVHDFVGVGIATVHADHWVVENSRFDHFACTQPGGTYFSSCGCGAGDPGGCRGWDAAPDYNYYPSTGQHLKNSSNAIAFMNASHNIAFRHNYVSDAIGHPSVELYASGTSRTCADDTQDCPDNVSIEDNDLVGASIGLNGAKHVRVVRNHIDHTPSQGCTGDCGVGIFVSASPHFDVTIQENTISYAASSGIVLKPSGPGVFLVDGNILAHNCQSTHDNGNIWAWAWDDPVLARDFTISNNIAIDSSGCPDALKVEVGSQGAIGGNVRVLGGTYATGSSEAVSINQPNVEVRGLKVTGNLVFGALATGFASALDVSGTITNPHMCILNDSGTPIPASCVAAP